VVGEARGLQSMHSGKRSNRFYLYLLNLYVPVEGKMNRDISHYLSVILANE
jgi:hypothetical protein